MLRLTGRALALAMLLSLAFSAFSPAQAAPTRCRIGAYLISISQVDTASGTFKADFWLWSVCPARTPEPLRTMEFVNAVSTTASLDSMLERKGEWWATRKISGTFRENFALEDYPFDAEPLRIDIEEGALDTRELVYVADTGESGIDPSVKMPGWRIKDFQVTAVRNSHPTTYGDPSLPGGKSEYAGLNLRLGVERAHVANFIKATFSIYIAVLLALVSLLNTDGRISLCGATVFAVVLSFVSVERIVGVHDGIYLLDQLHVGALLLILAATGWGVYSLHARAHGGDHKLWLRRDRKAALALLGLAVASNLGLILLAVTHHPAS